MCLDCSIPSTDSDTNSIYTHTVISGSSNTHHLHAPVLSVDEKVLNQLQTQIPQPHVYVWPVLTTGVSISPKWLHHCIDSEEGELQLCSHGSSWGGYIGGGCFGLGWIVEEWIPADCSCPLAFRFLPVEKLQVSTEMFQHLLDCATNLAHKSKVVLEQSHFAA